MQSGGNKYPHALGCSSCSGHHEQQYPPSSACPEPAEGAFNELLLKTTRCTAQLQENSLLIPQNPQRNHHYKYPYRHAHKRRE